MYVLLLNFSRTPGLRLVQKHKQQSHKRRNCSLSRVHPGEESIRRIWEHLPTQSIRESERAALKGAPIFLGHREKHNRDCRRYPANDDAVINANINLCPTFIPRPLGFINLPASPILSLSLSLSLFLRATLFLPSTDDSYTGEFLSIVKESCRDKVGNKSREPND